jgi:hypothetical protein
MPLVGALLHPPHLRDESLLAVRSARGWRGSCGTCSSRQPVMGHCSLALRRTPPVSGCRHDEGAAMHMRR